MINLYTVTAWSLRYCLLAGVLSSGTVFLPVLFPPSLLSTRVIATNKWYCPYWQSWKKTQLLFFLWTFLHMWSSALCAQTHFMGKAVEQSTAQSGGSRGIAPRYLGSCTPTSLLRITPFTTSDSLELCRDDAQAYYLQESLLMLGQSSLLGRLSGSFVSDFSVNGSSPFSTQMVYFSMCHILPKLFCSKYNKRLPIALSSTTLNGKCC